MLTDTEITLECLEEYELRDSTIAFSATVMRIEDGKAFIKLSVNETTSKLTGSAMFGDYVCRVCGYEWSDCDCNRKVIQYYDFD